MKFLFNKKINDFLKIIVKSANSHNINVYFVGGIVRDNILKRKLKDIDIIIDSNAIDFVKSLPQKIKIKSTHKDFYTAKVEYNGLSIDIASTRTEHYPCSGCLPMIDRVGVSIQEDCLRRDFTINAMYAKITLDNNELKYELIDFKNGITDIKNKTLKVLHDKSYLDDPTRILRGVDFKYRFNFNFSKNDTILINNYLKNPNLDNASKDRIISVFKKIVNKNNFKEIINCGYYKIINNTDLKIDFKLLKSQGAILDSEFCLKLIENQDIAKKEISDKYEIIQEFSKYSESELAYYFYKTKDSNVNIYKKIKNIKLLINGNDLLELGFKEGKNIGIALKTLLKDKIENIDLYKTKQDELNFVKNNIPFKIK